MHSEVMCESLELILDFNWFSLQHRVFDTSLQKIANVLLTAAVKQSAKVQGPLVYFIEQGKLRENNTPDLRSWDCVVFATVILLPLCAL